MSATRGPGIGTIMAIAAGLAVLGLFAYAPARTLTIGYVERLGKRLRVLKAPSSLGLT